MRIDEIILEEVKDIPLEVPLFHYKNFLIWKKFQGFSIDLCLTYPYELDGTVPLVFFVLGWFEFMVESPKLYNYLYKKRYGVDLDE